MSHPAPDRNTSVDLAFTEYGDGRPLLVLHGLFGSSRNWRSFSKRMAQNYRVINLDLRNHGESPWHPVMNYEVLAGDVARFIRQQGLRDVTVLGHSMGGKTSMMLALDHIELVEELIIVDIAPVPYSHSNAAFCDALLQLDLAGLDNRAQADEQLRPAIPDAAIRAFLLQNLVNSDGHFKWRFNLPVLKAAMDELTDFPQITAGRRYSASTLFVYGKSSDYVTADYHPAIRRLFPEAVLEGIPDAGHWLHAEQPGRFMDIVSAFIAQ